MKILVVYYSRDGLTRKIAASLADLLKAESEELVDLTNRRGLWGWLFAGRDALKSKLTRLDLTAKSPADYDLVVVGSPVWAYHITPAIRTYLSANAGKIKKAAFFCTKGGGPTGKFFAEMAAVSGREPLATLDIKRGEELTGIATHKIIQFVDEIKRNA